MKYILSILILLTIAFKPSAQVRIICNEENLAKKPLPEVTYAKAIEMRIGGEFESCELKNRNKHLVAADIHPFIASLYYAYAEHRPISISPDMIWLLICQGFTNHVNNNAEALRSKFVNFNGKKKIVVNTETISNEFIKGSAKSPWPLAFPIIADSISHYVKSDIHNAFVKSFSTTTFVEKSAYEIAMMDVMSGYFDDGICTLCGIPIINIEGTTSDWLKIKKGLNSFKGYKIDYWINSLNPIIQQFVDASQNKIDTVFWSNIFKRKDESGGPYIMGWIIKFFPYIYVDKNKMEKNPFIKVDPKEFDGLTTCQFTNGLSKVDFIWNYYGTKYEMEFMSGFIGINQDKKTLMLRPEIGWIVKDKNKKIAKDKQLDKVINHNCNTSNWKLYLIISLLGLLVGFCIYIKLKMNK